jgi:hypothetical protein
MEINRKLDCQLLIQMIGRTRDKQMAPYASQPDGPLKRAGGYIYVHIYVCVCIHIFLHTMCMRAPDVSSCSQPSPPYPSRALSSPCFHPVPTPSPPRIQPIYLICMLAGTCQKRHVLKIDERWRYQCVQNSLASRTTSKLINCQSCLQSD